MSESGSCTVWTRANGPGHCATILNWLNWLNPVFAQFGLGPMVLDTVQQFWTGYNTRIGYLHSSDSGQWAGTLCNKSELVKMPESGICTVRSRANGPGHCATSLNWLKCPNRVFARFGLGPMVLDTVQQFWTAYNTRIGYLHSSDSGQWAWTLCNKSELAKMFKSGIYPIRTRTNGLGHCATILT